jgi:Heparinase II/III-like protein/Heparinase II/III N-terminus
MNRDSQSMPHDVLDRPQPASRANRRSGKNAGGTSAPNSASVGGNIDLLKARWYWSRLASMQPAEILWRARSAATLPLDWAQWKNQPAVPAPKWAPLDPASYPVKLHTGSARMEHIHAFDLEFPVGFDFDWHRDYRYERQVEPSFAGTMNIRDTAVVSDIKYVWEPSRFQHLSALAFAANGEEQINYIVRSIDSWLEANPYLYGVNWTSSLELAERVISWAMLYPRIADQVARDEKFRRRWLDSIYLHLTRISRKLSLYSSANNHLIGELIGLFMGASCFNFWPECEGWRNRAQKLLEREILLQIGEDGVNREQAMSYHLFTMELFLLAFAIGRNTGHAFSEKYANRLRGMAAFLHSIATPSGDLPWYGDSDDARGFVLSEEDNGFEVVMQLAGFLFSEPRWLAFNQHATLAPLALVPDLIPAMVLKLAQDSNSAPWTEKPRELFSDAGLACVQSNDGSVKLLMDFGPLGFTSMAAHGHADALAIWLAIGGEYFLVDAGTYAYHSHPEWREYFRSTAAHNTACIDGENQSKMAGRFLWSAKANSRLLRLDSNNDQVTIDAEHDGYLRLPEPVTHRRTVHFDRGTGNVSLEDNFRGTGKHQVELFFHLHEDAEVLNVRDGEAQIRWHNRLITFSSPDLSSPDGTTRWEILRGSENPRLGWRSHSFNQKQPIATLRLRTEIDGSSNAGSTKIRTHLRIN